MKINKFNSFLSIILTTSLILIGCKKEKEDVVNCTFEFRYITVDVIGDSLTEFYTVRKSNLDTIKPSQNMPIINNTYEVLSDAYFNNLKNRTDQFEFIGLINDTIRIRENFLIKGDDCHISKISGVKEISI